MGEPIKLTANSSFGEKIAEGAYAHKAKIKSVIDFSNYPGQQGEPNKYKSGYEPEICLILKLEREGSDKEREFKATGWFQKDKNKRVVGWAWSDALHLLTEFVSDDDRLIDSDDFHVYPSTLEKLVGQEIIYVSYITPGTYTNDKGELKPSYADWGRVFHHDATVEEIQSSFQKSLDYLADEKRGNWRYAPEETAKWDKSTKLGYSMEDNEAIKAMAPKDEDMPF